MVLTALQLHHTSVIKRIFQYTARYHQALQLLIPGLNYELLAACTSPACK